jgi:hypothetical protein
VLPMFCTAMMLMMQIMVNQVVDSDCDARRKKGCGGWWACRGLPVVGGWGVGPVTWIGSEGRDELRTGSLEKVPPSGVQEARLKPNPWRPNAVDDGPWR